MPANTNAISITFLRGDNNMKLIKLLNAFIVICSGCSFVSNQKQEEQTIDIEIPFDHDYQEVSDYELTWESMFDVNDENYYVYFYSSSCSHCLELKNYIIKKAIDRGDIYFVKGSSKDQITNDSKKLIGAEIPGDFYILGYPTLALISNKKCTKNMAGVAQIKAELK